MTLTQKQLETRIGYAFKDTALLRLALTHRSAQKAHNERLELLGDAILGFLLAEALYLRYPDATEGDLSRLRATLVNRDTLVAIAQELELGGLLQLGTGERKSGGSTRPSILCDAFEALVGAVYLDGGMELCRQCILQLYESRLGKINAGKDAKTRLQEIMQSRGLPLPAYQVVATEGEEHEQVFKVQCAVVPLEQATLGVGGSRRAAEQLAAAEALKKLGATE